MNYLSNFSDISLVLSALQNFPINMGQYLIVDPQLSQLSLSACIRPGVQPISDMVFNNINLAGVLLIALFFKLSGNFKFITLLLLVIFILNVYHYCYKIES